MLLFSYQVKRMNIGGVIRILGWLAIQINSIYFASGEIFLIHTHKLPSRKVFSAGSVSTTNSAMGQCILQVDSARQTGLESTFQEVLTAVESGGGEGG